MSIITPAAIEKKIMKLEHDTKVSEKKYYSYAEDKESQDIIAFYLSHINEEDRMHIIELWENERNKRENWHKKDGWHFDTTYLQQQNNITFCSLSLVFDRYIQDMPNGEHKDRIIEDRREANTALAVLAETTN
jgi:hypothetical protein